MDFKNTLSLIGGLIVVIGFIGAAAVFIKGSVYKGAIAALEVTVNAQKANLVTIDAEIKSLKERDNVKDIKIVALEKENEMLSAQRPSAEIISTISSSLDAHHLETIALLKDVLNHE